LIKEGAKLVTRAEDILEEIVPLQEPGPPQAPPAPQLSEEETRVFSVLSAEPRHVDEVILKSALSSAKVSVILLSLELAGHIKQLPGMRFVKT
jgi:DNA processing protein